jgi:hypothetical protein
MGPWASSKRGDDECARLALFRTVDDDGGYRRATATKKCLYIAEASEHEQYAKASTGPLR